MREFDDLVESLTDAALALFYAAGALSFVAMVAYLAFLIISPWL